MSRVFYAASAQALQALLHLRGKCGSDHFILNSPLKRCARAIDRTFSRLSLAPPRTVNSIFRCLYDRIPSDLSLNFNRLFPDFQYRVTFIGLHVPYH